MSTPPSIHHHANERHANETLVWANPDELLPVYGSVVYLLIIPIICSVGVITNLLNIIVFARPRLWNAASSSYCYFLCRTNPLFKYSFLKKRYFFVSYFLLRRNLMFAVNFLLFRADNMLGKFGMVAVRHNGFHSGVWSRFDRIEFFNRFRVAWYAHLFV